MVAPLPTIGTAAFPPDMLPAPPAAPTGGAPTIVDLAARLDTLEARVAALESSSTATPGGPMAPPMTLPPGP